MNFRKALGNIVGLEWVFDDDTTCDAYSGNLSFTPARPPECVVKPADADQVESIVRWANRTGTPLVPSSSGPPRFHGGTTPRMGGVLVDLARMDRIVRIDQRNRVALIEPGVTFDRLQAELEEEGLRAIPPLLTRQGKSVVGSVLEREPIPTPRCHWDISDPLLCVEVTFGTGDRFWTGEAAGPGDLEKQWASGGAQKFPLGPHQIDYYRILQGAQGTMGIVTWASVKCEILPRSQRLFFFSSEDLQPLIDLAYRLIRVDLGDAVFILNGIDLAMISAALEEIPDAEATAGAGVPVDDLATIEKISRDLPAWTLVVTLAGLDPFPEERLAYQQDDMLEHAGTLGLEPAMSLNGLSGDALLGALAQPSPDPHWKLRAAGGCHDIFFLTTLDRSPRYVNTMLEMAEAHGVPASSVGAYIQPTVQGTSCHCEFSIPFDPVNPDEAERIRGLSLDACESLVREGAFFSRPYSLWADTVYSRRTEYVIAARKVKEIFDPNHVMNPGKLCF